MTPTTLARLLAASRVAIGTMLFVAPRTAGRPWVGEAVDPAGGRLALRGLGARDVALGVGTLAALAADGPVHRWLEASAAADLGDAAAALLARDELPAPVVYGIVAAASGAAGMGLYLRRALAGTGVQGEVVVGAAGVEPATSRV